MTSDNLFKIAVSQLHRTPDNEIVKVAGILARIKNWLKGKFNPEFAASIEDLKEKSTHSKYIIDNLEKHIDLLQSAIKDGDLVIYEKQLEIIKAFSAKLISNISQTSEKVTSMTKGLRFTEEDRGSEGFEDRFRASMPESFNLPLGKSIDKPLLSIEHYSFISPERIAISSGTFLVLKDRIQKVLTLRNIPFDIEDVSADQLIALVRESIINGVLIQVDIKSPSKTIKNQKLGAIEILVSGEPFELPGSNIVIEPTLYLLDKSTTPSRTKQLTLRATESIEVFQSSKKSSSRLDQLVKIADQIPITWTKLSDVQFAEVMRKGYQKVFGKDPTAEVLGIGWAQGIVESASRSGSGVDLPCNNVGNIRAGGPWEKSGKPYFVNKTYEKSKDGKTTLTDHGATWRAFETPEDGAASYWELLKNNYPTSIKWMEAGDPVSANATLGLKGYYTASIKKYSSAVGLRYDQFINNVLPKLGGLKSDPKDPPSEKPEIKEWSSDYSKDELSEILMPKGNQSLEMVKSLPANDNDAEENVDDLFEKLVAHNSISQIKKQSRKDQWTLIRFQSPSKLANLAVADYLSFLSQKYLRGVTQICSDKESSKIDLEIKLSQTSADNSYKILSELARVANQKVSNEGETELVDFFLAPNVASSFSLLDGLEIEKKMQHYRGLVFKNGK